MKMRSMPTTDDVTFRDHALELTRYATAIAGPTDADDIVASAFARAMSSTNWHTILDRRAYLYQTVLNEVRDRHRSRTRRERREFAVREQQFTQDLPIRAEVLDVMNDLSPRQRSVLFCVYWLDLDSAQTAERLGLSVRSVQREAHIARRRMKALLT